jgi:methionyl-tRNA formyltransferase
MKEPRAVFIGGKQLGVNCLRSAVDRGFRPLFVVANPDDLGIDTWHQSLVRVAEGFDIPCVSGERPKNQEIVAKISGAQPDVIFCIGSTEIIPPPILKASRMGVINIHPALLPKYRGRYSIPHAIFNGDALTGVTLHFMDEGIDSGPIILQESFPLGDDDTAKSAYDRFTEIGVRLFERFLVMLNSSESIPATPQDEREATYYRQALPNGGILDWTWDGPKIRRFIRAMTFEPFPPPTFTIGAKVMAIADYDGFRPSD